MKNIIIGFFCLLSLQLFSQNEEVIKLRKSYKILKTDKSVTVRFPKKSTINLDTTLIEVDSSQLKFLKEFSILDNKKLVKDYKRHVFKYSKTKKINQFYNAIIIYLDEKLPKQIIADFKAFIKDIPQINNLELSFTKDINKATYFIDIVDKEVSAFSNKDREELDETKIKNYTFSQMTYKLNINSNNKYISCHYKISPSIINNTLFLTKLKKGFLRSLGSFYESYKAPKESFLYNKPNENNIYLTDYDFMILKFHYEHLYEFDVNSKVFNALINLRKKKKKKK